MKLLLVDHACHKKTQSFGFFHRMLEERFDVKTFYYDRHGCCRVPREFLDESDWVVFLEFLPWRFRLGIPGKKCLFVPMYDNEWGSVWQWRRLAASGMHVLSFCGKVAEHARKCGVPGCRLLDVRFAVAPSKVADLEGDARRLLIWERGDVTFEAVKALFAPEDLDEVLVLRHPEEGLRHEAISEGDRANYHVRVAEVGFLPAEEYRNLVRPYGLVLAPRFKEGIGMSFLEYMAMGKVVIAHDDATMCEAIAHGRNGWLTDLRHPSRVDVSALRRIHEEGFDASASYRRWQEDSIRIHDFLESPTAVNMNSAATFGQILRYMLYLIEGARMRMKGEMRFSNGNHA